MAPVPDALGELFERFDRQYERGRSEIMQVIERSVCGCDYGGTSWTTRREADEVGRRLGLRKGVHLLDLGAGSGWPALYLARRSGCDVTLVDVPAQGIRIAAERARADAPDGACRMSVGDGGALPFKDRTFDALSHSDVLCCLPEKAAVLRECARVLRPGGRMVFTVISVAPGLPPRRRAKAVEFGPPYVEADCEYPEMLAKTGWRVTDSVDISVEFADSVRRFVEACMRNEEKLIALIGETDFDDIIVRNSSKLEVIEGRGLCRHLYAAAINN